MSSLTITEAKIYDDLIASLRVASRSRAEATLALVPAEPLRYGGGTNSRPFGAETNIEKQQQQQKKKKTKTKGSYTHLHNRYKSAHAIGDHRIYGTSHFPVSTRAASIRHAIRHDLLEEEEAATAAAKDEQEGAAPSSASGLTLHGALSNSPSTDNMNYVSEMLRRATAEREGMDIETRAREEASVREAAFLARIKKRENMAREATEKEIIRERVTHLVDRKFRDTAAAEDKDGGGDESSGVYFSSEGRIEELEELWERRNSHLMKKASRRHPAPELVEGGRGPTINAYHRAIRRSSLAVSMGAAKAMKSKISGYQLLGLDERTEKTDEGQDGSVATLWR